MLSLDDKKREIARKYMLPERPFLHGMASAFDMFGVLSEGKREQLLANLLRDFETSKRSTMKDTWAQVGLHLYHAIKLYEGAESECGLE